MTRWLVRRGKMEYDHDHHDNGEGGEEVDEEQQHEGIQPRHSVVAHPVSDEEKSGSGGGVEDSHRLKT